MHDASGSFAHELRLAIDRRGLALDRIRERLEQRGVTVSVATLSYWQSGRSLPGRKASIAALPHLEDVLALDPGHLRRTLPLTRDRPRRSAVPGLEALWPETPRADLLSSLDTRWDADLERVVLHDILRIGPDRRQVSLTVRQVLRARADGPDRRVVLHCHDDRSAPPAQIRALQGCEVGRVLRSEDHGATAAELLFHSPLSRGDTVIIEYVAASPGPGPLETTYSRRLRMPMREYLLQVEFDAGALPDETIAFTDERDSAITLDPAHRAHLAHTDVTPGVAGMRWTWAEPDDGLACT